MEEKTNGRYFYLMLKENFYDSDDMILLESMENGYLYSNILLKLYLKSLKDKGKLMYKDRIPYNAEMLAKLTRQNVDVVRQAIKIFKEMGIIEILDNGAIFMLDIENYIGKSSTEADRRRKYDRRIAEEKKKLIDMEKPCEKSCEKSHEHIELELDTNINIKKKEIYKERKVFQKPTIDDIITYCNERNNGINAEAFYDFYESKDWYVGKNKMKDWKACIRTWEQRNQKGSTTPEWFNKEIDKNITQKEQDELNDLLKDFKEGRC